MLRVCEAWYYVGHAQHWVLYLLMPEWGKAYPYLELGYCPCLKTFETQPSNAAPHSQADRAWREAESVITMSRTSDSTMRRVQIGNELLLSL